MKSTPRHWFFRTTGPVLSAPSPTVEFLPILTLPGRSDRSRTIPESQELVVEADEDEDDKEEEVAEEFERFISTILIHPP